MGFVPVAQEFSRSRAAGVFAWLGMGAGQRGMTDGDEAAGAGEPRVVVVTSFVLVVVRRPVSRAASPEPPPHCDSATSADRAIRVS